MNSTYAISTAQAVLNHFPAHSMYFRDIDPKRANPHRPAGDDSLLRMHARVRSDDYCATIATELEQIIEAIQDGASGQAQAVLPELERLAAELLAVGKAYKLVPKQSR